jgi:hypothetical protein
LNVFYCGCCELLSAMTLIHIDTNVAVFQDDLFVYFLFVCAIEVDSFCVSYLLVLSILFPRVSIAGDPGGGRASAGR